MWKWFVTTDLKLNRLEFTMQAAGRGLWEQMRSASGKMGAAVGDLGQG